MTPIWSPSGNIAGEPGTEADLACSDGPGVLFVTDEVFLPHANGSGQIYTAVAREYADQGWRTHCLSFYRDPDVAAAPQTRSAYAAHFADFMLVPGWNLGGARIGKLAMAWRELARWRTGDVFASHPFHVARRKDFQDELARFMRRRRISEVYFHKPHTLLLLRDALPRLNADRLVLDLHDDFVARSEAYSAAYKALFRNLPVADTLRQHRAMYLRHTLCRPDTEVSRRSELSLLSTCSEIRVASRGEYERYARIPGLQGRVRHKPWPYSPAFGAPRYDRQPRFHAGFIGADSVMNLDAVIHLRDHILPHVRRLLPGFRMLLAGTLARKVGPLLNGVANVEVWPVLPQVIDFYAAIGAAAVPLRHGTGVSVKAIEALAHGCPLVTTSVGIRGVDASRLSEADIEIADDPAAFATALVRRGLTVTAPSAETSACRIDPPCTAVGQIHG